MTPKSNISNSCQVLLIEDDEDDYIITRDLFQEIRGREYQLDWVDTFQGGLEALARKEHDVYLVDYRLGPHNGLEFLEAASRAGCTAPIILLTGLGDFEIDVKAMKAGAADYLVKGQITAPLLERSIHHSLARKAAEIKLRQSEEQYRLLFEQNPHPMWVVDPQTMAFLAVNQAALAHYGYTADEFQTMRLPEIQMHEPTVSLVSGGGMHLPAKHRRKDGSLISVEVTCNEIAFKDQPALLYLAQDITHKLDLEAQLRQSQKMESVGALAGGIAHDFNNILAIITAYTSQLKSAQPDPDKLARCSDAIDKAAERGAALVRQILTFARKTDVTLERVNPNLLLTDIGKLLVEAFPKTINFEFQLQDTLPSIEADPTQLHQTILNLCVNARDAMPEGGVLTLGTSIASGAELRKRFPEAQSTHYVCLTVRDTGTGMDSATLGRIFEPFFSTKGRDRGTGLGLAVVYGIVKNHHGFIDVRSALGQGTTFLLYLPQAAPDAAAPASTPPSPAARGGEETLLFVEDEDLLLDLMKTLLETQGYRILTASNGLEGVELYQTHASEIALVILDMGLPKLSGADAFYQMKEINPDLVAIIVSGYLDPSIKTKLLSAGLKDFLPKPYQPTDLFKTIRNVLDANPRPARPGPLLPHSLRQS